MVSKKEIAKFIKSQKSIRNYIKFQEVLAEVLSTFSSEEYKKTTKNLIIVVLHEGALGQVMHFPSMKSDFKILQITLPKRIPLDVLKFVVAHEFGHVYQGRNWRVSDGLKLEENADLFAKQLGFPKNKKVENWLKKYENLYK